jgi:LysR family transcriptional activator of nhaA
MDWDYSRAVGACSDVKEQFGAIAVGEISQVREQFYAISNERKIKHPAIDAILSAIHGRVFTTVSKRAG